MTINRRFSVVLLAFALISCAADGHKQVEFTDTSANSLNNILAVPLYSKSFGLGVGADGAGPHTAPRKVITNPFMIDSGEDIMLKKAPTRWVILFPIPPVAISNSNYVHRWLFLKAGFAPTVVSAFRKQGPIVMTPTDTDQVGPVVDLLLSPSPHQAAIKKLYNADDIKEPIAVEMDADDIALVRGALH